MSAYFNNKNLETAGELAEVNGKTLISGIEPVIDSAVLWQKGPSMVFFQSTSLKAGAIGCMEPFSVLFMRWFLFIMTS